MSLALFERRGSGYGRTEFSQSPSEFIASLPTDEESPERALAFRKLMSHSRDSGDAAWLVRETYRLAAIGLWGGSLHDLQMLVTAIELNPRIMRAVAKYVGRILSNLPERTAAGYRAWLRRQTTMA